MIYSSQGWHRGLDSACWQTKTLQYYSDPVSALSTMRSPQCYVSLTEKVFTLRKMLFCFTDAAQTRVIYTEHTNMPANTHSHKHKERKVAALSPFGIFWVNLILTQALSFSVLGWENWDALSISLLMSQSLHYVMDKFPLRCVLYSSPCYTLRVIYIRGTSIIWTSTKQLFSTLLL